jgi:hypothetical protein
MKRTVPRWLTLRDKLFLLSRIDPKTKCWIWEGKRLPAGYGILWDPEKETNVYVHRLSFEMFKGTIENEIDHLCRNRACWHPDHLEDVSHRENLSRGNTFTARNLAKDTCKYGHKYDAINYRGNRRCKTCEREFARKYRLLKRLHSV